MAILWSFVRFIYHNDYSYVLDEETGKWGFYAYKKDELQDLEETLKEE